MKKFGLAAAFALSLAFTTVSAPAFAGETFRSAPAQTFTQADLQSYGLSADDASQVGALQDQGYQVQVVSAEEAERMTGGQFSNNQWLVIGLIVVVVIVAVSAD